MAISISNREAGEVRSPVKTISEQPLTNKGLRVYFVAVTSPGIQLEEPNTTLRSHFDELKQKSAVAPSAPNTADDTARRIAILESSYLEPQTNPETQRSIALVRESGIDAPMAAHHTVVDQIKALPIDLVRQIPELELATTTLRDLEARRKRSVSR